ncbi:MAG: formylglycine-generating enzyme family protein, partial [Pirellulaceae bacterium]|nr:formylglycine-generating enzyme family protein [Pirellulaceae bacterium]
VLALDCVNPEVCRSVVGDGRRREAVSYVQAAARAHGGLSEERKGWLSLLVGWMPDTVHDAELREAFSRIVDGVRPPGPLAEVPAYYTPQPDEQAESRTVDVVQQGGRLTFTPRSAREPQGVATAGSGGDQGSPVALIISTSNRWTLEAGWAQPVFPRPAWASEFGRDRFGFHAAFRVDDVVQRMRWIPAGSFLMGSLQSEKGDSDERPPHRVTLSHGFWMFDTPCTQALWHAVSQDDPSHFKGPRRPVERVSWRDVQTFLAKFNERLPQLRLVLPTEAQWEYACRAGSQEARYGELDQIAWHGGNSGSETHPVGQKAPNDWGLYDMLGNVDEWCQDHGYRSYQDREERDPLYQTDDDNAYRVSRGGGWASTPRWVRAAFRVANHPGLRWNFQGFRAVSSGEPSQEGGAGPHRIDAERSGAEPVSVPAKLIDWKRATGPVSVALPDRPLVRIHTRRCETWTLARVQPPEWAAETGRDSYGLWADFTLENVTQRMRWIPPGRFVMGSPPDDTERYTFEMEAHAETVEQGFWIFNTPCRQVLWSSVRSDNPSKFKGKQRPVESVTWDEAVDFLKVLGERIGLALVLPSEKQWEYACRAGSTDSRYGPLDAIAWHGGNSGGQTQEVALKQPNAWGLYDTLGNVYEWCSDRHGAAGRVFRGGLWDSPPRRVRAAYRVADLPGNRWGHQGFRAVSSGEPSQDSGAGPNRIDAERSGAEPSSVPAEPSLGSQEKSPQRGPWWRRFFGKGKA